MRGCQWHNKHLVPQSVASCTFSIPTISLLSQLQHSLQTHGIQPLTVHIHIVSSQFRKSIPFWRKHSFPCCLTCDESIKKCFIGKMMKYRWLFYSYEILNCPRYLQWVDVPTKWTSKEKWYFDILGTSMRFLIIVAMSKMPLKEWWRGHWKCNDL